ncbi:hypothetical protein GGP73_003128 [Salinibacter ruber]|nr:hypothetical protein [Salinibacter ruber]
MSDTNVSNLFFQRSTDAVVRTTITRGSSIESSRPKHCGAPWRDMPELQGNWWAAHDRFRRWAEDGTLESAAWHLQGELHKVNSMPRDLSTGASSMWTARSSRQPEPPPDRTIVKRGSNQLRRRPRLSARLWTYRSCEVGSQPLVHLLTDRQGLPLGAVLSARQRHGISLLYRPDRRSIDTSVPRTAPEAPRRRRW